MAKLSNLCISLAVFTQLFSSCIKENLANCGGVKVNFIYTQHNKSGDLIENNISDIKLFIFNSLDSLLYENVDVTPSEIWAGYKYLNLPKGRYSFVAWGASGDELLDGGYSVGEATDLKNHKFKDIEIGATKITDLMVMIADTVSYNNGNSFTDNLFHSNIDDVEVRYDEDDDITLDFVKNNNSLSVSLTGLPSSSQTRSDDDSLYDIYLMAKNSRYDYRNSIDDTATEVKCNSVSKIWSADSLVRQINMLKIDIERHNSDPIKLFIKDKESGKYLVEPIDLLKTLLQVKDSLGVNKFATQNDLDREDNYTISLDFTKNLGVKVSVNGYEIKDVFPEF